MSGESRGRTIKEITDTEIYFSSRSQFNDPFDCNIKIQGLSPSEQLEIDSILEETGIFCLSEVNDNPLMWSHYADSHKGVCVEYVTSENRIFGCDLIRADYVKCYPTFSSTDYPDQAHIRRYLSAKSIHWEYEREWRVIYHSLGIQNAPTNELTAVILGCRISDHDRRAILEAIAMRKETTAVYQSRLDEKAFQLKFEKL